jgi:hypothetical protein
VHLDLINDRVAIVVPGESRGHPVSMSREQKCWVDKRKLAHVKGGTDHDRVRAVSNPPARRMVVTVGRELDRMAWPERNAGGLQWRCHPG